MIMTSEFMQTRKTVTLDDLSRYSEDAEIDARFLPPLCVGPPFPPSCWRLRARVVPWLSEGLPFAAPQAQLHRRPGHFSCCANVPLAEHHPVIEASQVSVINFLVPLCMPQLTPGFDNYLSGRMVRCDKLSIYNI